MKIKNEVGKAKKECGCVTWLEHWEKSAKKKAGKCGVIGCADPATAGTLVIKPSMGPVPYILPLCAAHAAELGKELEVAESALLVRANKLGTCS